MCGATEVRALTYDLTPEEEVRMFLIVNNVKRVNNNYLVFAWPGVAGELIRSWNLEGLLEKKISFRGNRRGMVQAAVLARIIFGFLTKVEAKAVVDQPIATILQGIDHHLALNVSAAHKARAFAGTIHLVFPDGVPIAIGASFAAAWTRNGTPSEPVFRRLKALQWKQYYEKFGREYDSYPLWAKLLDQKWAA
jgi:hypothetical protein